MTGRGTTPALFEDARTHEASFLTVGTQVLVVRTVEPGSMLSKDERRAFGTLALRGFDVLILRLNTDGNPASGLVAPAWRALDAPEAFDDLASPDAVQKWIHAWLKNARRAAIQPPPAAPTHGAAQTSAPPTTDATLLEPAR